MRRWRRITFPAPPAARARVRSPRARVRSGRERLPGAGNVPALRTLIVSDLHLGIRRGTDVLRRAEPLARLVAAAREADRLILLGDVVELGERRPQRALAIAAPVLRALGSVVSDVVIVPGNHDGPLVARWARDRGAQLDVSEAVPIHASGSLARIAALLAPARIRVFYPGFWAREDVWVMHGHQINRHLLPASTVGIRREWLGRPSGARSPGDYERRLPGGGGHSVWATPLVYAREQLEGRFAPLVAWVLGIQMRRAALPAARRVLTGFEIAPRFAVFGHIHRLGPLAGDDPDVWGGSAGWDGPGEAPLLLNAGSWLYEALLVRHASPPHPYWPGGAIVIDGDQPPRAVGLLDDLSPRELLAAAAR